MDWLTFLILLVILFILWNRVVIMYYNYWFYTRQGVKAAGFPWPFVGILLKFKKIAFKDEGEFTDDPYLNYFQNIFGQKQPPIVIINSIPNGLLIYNDPEVVSQLYNQKNKYIDKFQRIKNIMFDLFGNSMLLEPSTELQAQKRKHVSAAFYKERMVKMLQIISDLAYTRIEEWKEKFVNCEENNEMVFVKEISDLIMDSISATVFGMSNAYRKIVLLVDGQEKEVNLGGCLRYLFYKQIGRITNPIRLLLYPLFPRHYFKSEKETLINCLRLRSMVQEIINERKQQLSDPNFKDDHNFLTQIIQDELFQKNESFLVDECITFMLASTQTSTQLISNAIKHLIVNKDILQKLREELKQGLKKDSFQGLNVKEWREVLNYEDLNQLSHLTYVINETLRINPPILISTGVFPTETITLAGTTILKGQPGCINIHYLQHNPDEWQEPLKFIPERFDPQSKYYLTPGGKKRHPMSYGPFLGGRRICLGKTFAENIGRLLLTMIITQLDFEFVNKLYYERLPTNIFANTEPTYTVTVKLVE